jgi:histidine decarboxylase
LVVATVGTTFKGAIDDLDAIRKTLIGYPSYLHVDAALFGGYLPFTEHASEMLHGESPLQNAGRYDSIAVSCHKFFGFPSPAGLFITRQSLYEEFTEFFSRIHNPEYVHQVPGTITCSRDAVKPAEFFYHTTPSARKRQVADAQSMLKNTSDLVDQLRCHFPQLGAVRANSRSNTVYFRDPGDAIIKKYSLATMHLIVNNRPERFAHVVVMPHVTQTILAEFLTDLESKAKKVARRRTELAGIA